MEEQEPSKVETIVKVCVLLWSATLLSLSYYEPPSGKKIVDFDPTFIASIFSASTASLGFSIKKKKILQQIIRTLKQASNEKATLTRFFIAAPCYANGVPTWTTGSSNRTENTTQTITRSVVTEKYGSTINTWEGSNISVAASAGISGGDAVFTVADTSKDWSLNVTSRASGLMIEKITQNDTINTTSVITSLSVFSQ